MAQLRLGPCLPPGLQFLSTDWAGRASSQVISYILPLEGQVATDLSWKEAEKTLQQHQQLILKRI